MGRKMSQSPAGRERLQWQLAADTVLTLVIYVLIRNQIQGKLENRASTKARESSTAGGPAAAAWPSHACSQSEFPADAGVHGAVAREKSPLVGGRALTKAPDFGLFRSRLDGYASDPFDAIARISPRRRCAMPDWPGPSLASRAAYHGLLHR